MNNRVFRMMTEQWQSSSCPAVSLQNPKATILIFILPQRIRTLCASSQQISELSELLSRMLD